MINCFAKDQRRFMECTVKREKLLEVCEIIHENYEALEREFCILERYIASTEKCEVAYRAEDRRMVFWHMRDIDWLDDIEVLKVIVNKLESDFKGAKEELFCSIDFFDFLNGLSKRNGKISEVEYIWKAKKVINSIEVQFEKIATTEDPFKQIAILKGMIALT